VGTFYFVPPPVSAAQIPVPLILAAASGAVFGSEVTGDADPRVQLQANAVIGFGNGASPADTTITRGGFELLQFNGTVDVTTIGKGLAVAEGANAKQGTFTLTGGTTQVVANTAVTANSRIFLTAQVVGGTPGIIGVNSRSAGTSFTVFCVATDTSTYAYEIFEPG
jgi:hypothetical protein